MQPTTRFQDSIANAFFREAYLVFHHPISLHPTDHVFNPDSDGRNRAIACLLRWCEFPPRGFFLGLEDCQPLTRIPLKAHILIETTSGWEGIAFELSEAFLIGLPFIGGTQETNMPSLVLGRMIAGIATLRKAGWPPPFTFVYDEFWQVTRGPAMTVCLQACWGQDTNKLGGFSLITHVQGVRAPSVCL
jgi:hypothetical protein